VRKYQRFLVGIGHQPTRDVRENDAKWSCCVWLCSLASGRESDSGSRGREFESHPLCCWVRPRASRSGIDMSLTNLYDSYPWKVVTLLCQERNRKGATSRTLQLQQRCASQTRPAPAQPRSQPKPALTAAAIQSSVTLVCRLVVATPVIHIITWITTHLPTLEGWKAELAMLADP